MTGARMWKSSGSVGGRGLETEGQIQNNSLGNPNCLSVCEATTGAASAWSREAPPPS